MKRPWTIALHADRVGIILAYTGPMGRFWTRRGAARRARELNQRLNGKDYRFVPVKTAKEPW